MRKDLRQACTGSRSAWHAAAGCSLIFAAALQSGVAAADTADRARANARSEYRAPQAVAAPVVDGRAGDAAWATAPWRAIDQRWLGPGFDDDDFRGRFKVVWTPEKLWILVELVDDVLYDRHRDPLVRYWDDDCLEVFLDEDFSGGDHQFNHNAFAYHVSLDNQAIDIGTDRAARNYSHHVQSQWKQLGGTVVWELGIDVHSDGYRDDEPDNRPTRLSTGKVLGLMLAYCDNDGSEWRENFVGSETVHDGKKDRGWIDASLFGKLVLDAAP